MSRKPPTKTQIRSVLDVIKDAGLEITGLVLDKESVQITTIGNKQNTENGVVLTDWEDFDASELSRPYQGENGIGEHSLSRS